MTRETAVTVASLVYWNRADAALFVEKRFGIGDTLNFAHRGAWFALAAIVAFPLLIVLIALLVSAGR